MHASHKRRHALIVLLVVGSLLSALAKATQTASLQTNYARDRRDSSTLSLKSLLNPDGSLNLSSGFNGSLDAGGYRMRIGPNGAPRFVPDALTAPGDERWDPQFFGSDVTHRVFAITISSDEIYIAGLFTTIGKTSANHVARYAVATQTWSALGQGSGPEGNGVEWAHGIIGGMALAVVGNDVYVGGPIGMAYNHAGNSIAANGIAKWNRLTNTWSPLGNGIYGDHFTISALAVSGSELYVGGAFDTAHNFNGSISANNIAKWNMLTDTWSALGSDNGLAGNGVNSDVYAIAVNGSNVYVGGHFTTAYDNSGSNVSTNRVARWDGAAWSALGTPVGNGVDDYVNAIAVSDSDLYVGGVFMTARNGDGSGVSANRIARWNGSAWSGLAGGVNGVVNAIVVIGGSVYVGGGFTDASNNDGEISALGVARWDGTNWSSLGDDPGANGNGVSHGQDTGVVSALAVNSGVLFVGGSFNQAGNSSMDHVPAANLARWDGASWSAPGNSAAGGNGVNGQVQAIAVKGDEIYIGGWFTKVGNLSVNHIAKWNSSTSTWSAVGPGPGARSNGVGTEGCSGGYCIAGNVSTIAVNGNDVYVGGNFDTVYNGPGGMVNAPNIARWETLTNTWSAVGRGTSGQIFAIKIDGDDIYVGGTFNTAFNSDNSVVNARNIARWNLTTNTWSAFGDGSDANNNGTDGVVRAIAVRGNEVYMIGGFTTACSSASNCTGANYVVRWNKITNTWSALGRDSGPAGNGLKLFNNNAWEEFDVIVVSNDVYVCGGFEAVYNSRSSRVATTGIAGWDGSSWFVLGSGASASGQGLSGIDGPQKMLAVGTDLYVIGHSTTTANNSETDHVTVNGIAKWNGAAWSALGGGLISSDSGYGAGLAASANHLYVGGLIAYTGGNITANFGRYQLPAANCSVKIASPRRTVSRTGASSHVNVNAQGSCSWTTVSNVPWITIISGGSGFGDGRVHYTVAANVSGSERIGTITISGQTFTIRQF